MKTLVLASRGRSKFESAGEIAASYIYIYMLIFLYSSKLTDDSQTVVSMQDTEPHPGANAGSTQGTALAVAIIKAAAAIIFKVNFMF